MADVPDVASLELLGGRLALDFVNTVEPREPVGGQAPPEPTTDFLPDYAALVRWAVHAGELSAAAGSRLARLAAADPAGAHAVRDRAIRLREALYRIVRDIALGGRVDPRDLQIVSAEEALTVAHGRLVETSPGGGMAEPAAAWVWPVSEDLQSPLWPVTRSAVELLTREDRSRLHVCDARAWSCGWVFYDDTRNRSRRWCNMGDCGSRAKAQRLTDRRRRSGTSGSGTSRS